ncbi:hypothetical protein THERU_00500 [Thermocrinis ruber]|uniref:Biopterin-dependent aromatic amino acid hydroxylase family profile domain-containing protein n=1 Tax=Thermocrinis ruber TaxID=75906 RepID=W0DIP5_9AQUI|nr:hypothetical protein THERU_00500 [Thermocrinis ruber]
MENLLWFIYSLGLISKFNPLLKRAKEFLKGLIKREGGDLL